MSVILDLLLVAIGAVSVIYGYKKGFFRSVMSLMSGVCALLCAYAFTPVFSDILKEKVIIEKVQGSMYTTFSSIAEAGKDSAEGIVYDLTKLSQSPQFEDTVKHCGADEGAIEELLSTVGANAEDVLMAVSRKVAQPVSEAFANILAFSLIFLGAFIAVRLCVFIISRLLKLPVLKNIDSLMGLIFGAVGGVFFVWMFSVTVTELSSALTAIAPASFKGDYIEGSVLVSFFARFNPFAGLISNIL